VVFEELVPIAVQQLPFYSPGLVVSVNGLDVFPRGPFIGAKVDGKVYTVIRI
jgi:hypothetical protein